LLFYRSSLLFLASVHAVEVITPGAVRHAGSPLGLQRTRPRSFGQLQLPLRVKYARV